MQQETVYICTAGKTHIYKYNLLWQKNMFYEVVYKDVY